MTSQVTSPISVLSDRTVTMTRVIAAPPDRVYQAYTDPAIVPRWWGLREFRTTVEQLDARPGGAWRYVQANPADDTRFGFQGEFREVMPGERLVTTWVFDGMPDIVMVEATDIEAVDGGTRVTLMASFDSAEHRDALLESGLEGGQNDLWDRLGEVLAATR